MAVGGSQSSGPRRELTIVGAGPGGMSFFLGNDVPERREALRGLLAGGILVVDEGRGGGASFHKYDAIESNTAGADFVWGLPADHNGLFGDVAGLPEVGCVRSAGRSSVPLRLVASMYDAIWSHCLRRLSRFPAFVFCADTRVTSCHYSGADGIDSILTDRCGDAKRARSRSVLFATGGQPRALELPAEWRPKCVSLDSVLSREGARAVCEMLRSVDRPRVTIVGNSHSAWSVVWLLTHAAEEGRIRLREGSIAVLTRGVAHPRLYAPSRAQAYPGVTSDDVCPKTGKVHRLGGLRAVQREMALKHAAGELSEVVLIPVSSGAARDAALESATIIVPATGFDARHPDVFRDGECVVSSGDTPIVVDSEARLLEGSGEPLAGFFAVGFRHNVPAGDRFGGEPRFRGSLDTVDAYLTYGAPIALRSILRRRGGIDWPE